MMPARGGSFRYDGDPDDDRRVRAFLVNAITWCAANCGTADLSNDDALAVAAGLGGVGLIDLLRILMMFADVTWHGDGVITIEVPDDAT